MIYQNDIFENTENLFANAVKDLQIGRLLHKSNIRKSCGVPVLDVFQFLLLLAAKVTSVFSSLTRPERIRVLVLDDSVITRARSKAVELLARVYDHVDHRSNGYKARKEALMKKTDAAVLLVRRALQAGIQADYVLMDTWFTTEPLIHALLAEGIHVIGMVKQLKQTYLYQGRYYTLPKLQKFMQRDGAPSVFGSVVVSTKKEGIPGKDRVRQKP